MCLTGHPSTHNDTLLELLLDKNSFIFLTVVSGPLPGSFCIRKRDVFKCSTVNQVWESAVKLKKKILTGQKRDISDASLSQCAAFISLLADFSPFFFFLRTFNIRDAEKRDVMS